MATFVEIPVSIPIQVYRSLLDYSGNVPIYLGQNEMFSLIADPTWRIQKLFYDSNNRVTDMQVLIGAWTNRNSLAWKPVGGD